MFIDNYRVVISDVAKRDIRNIHAVIARDAPDTADRYAQWLIGECFKLSAFPSRHRIARESRSWRMKVRMMPCLPYRVLYEIDERRAIVNIVRVHHSAQLPFKSPTED